MFRNLLKILLPLLTIVLLLTACGSNNENPQQGDSSADAQISNGLEYVANIADDLVRFPSNNQGRIVQFNDANVYSIERMTSDSGYYDRVMLGSFDLDGANVMVLLNGPQNADLGFRTGDTVTVYGTFQQLDRNPSSPEHDYAFIFNIADSSDTYTASQQESDEEWIIVTNSIEEFTLSIPSSWDYSHGEWDSIRISDEGIGGTISMTVNYVSSGTVRGQIQESSSRREFSFDNSNIGLILEFSDRDSMLLVDESFGFLVSIMADAFTDNEDLVLQIVRTLTPASPNGANQGAAVTQGGNLDERLFGTWVEQLEGEGVPDGLRLTRGFNPDGTGFWWGDGPGQVFTWRVDGNVLTMDIRCDDTNAEWTEIFRYEIVGDTLTFTHADGWQHVYHRDDGVHDSGFHNDWNHSFNRWEYLAFDTPSLEDVRRFPDQHVGSRMFLQNFEVRGYTVGGRVPIAPRFSQDILPVAAIDVSGLAGIGNALPGDIVTIYGTFVELALGIPLIRAEHFVFNNLIPDPAEFLPAVIEVINMHDNALQWEYEGWNEYLGNSRMNLVIERRRGIEGTRPAHVLRQGPGELLWVDGFLIALMHVDENNNRDTTTPFGIDTIHVDTVRFMGFDIAPWGNYNALLIRIMSEL